MAMDPESGVVRRKAPTQWWLLLATILVFVLAFVFLNGSPESAPAPSATPLPTATITPEPAGPCGQEVYLDAADLPNPLDTLSGDMTSLAFSMSGEQLVAEAQFIAYWNITEKGHVDSYIKNSGQVCRVDAGANAILCDGIEFFFPSGADEIIYEINLVNADPGCSSENVLSMEVLIDREGLQQVLRLEGDYLPEE